MRKYRTWREMICTTDMQTCKRLQANKKSRQSNHCITRNRHLCAAFDCFRIFIAIIGLTWEHVQRSLCWRPTCLQVRDIVHWDLIGERHGANLSLKSCDNVSILVLVLVLWSLSLAPCIDSQSCHTWVLAQMKDEKPPRLKFVEKHVEKHVETVAENCWELLTHWNTLASHWISLISWTIPRRSHASFLIFWMFATGAESVTLHLIAACNLTKLEAGKIIKSARFHSQLNSSSLPLKITEYLQYLLSSSQVFFLQNTHVAHVAHAIRFLTDHDRPKAMPQCSTTNATPLYHPGTFWCSTLSGARWPSTFHTFAETWQC